MTPHQILIVAIRLGSWPLLVRWFGGAIQGYIDVYV
jgi:hypothetical protein